MREIKVSKKTVAKSTFQDVLSILKIGVLVFVVMWVALSATIMRVIPSTSIGPTIVKNYTGPGGKPSPGDYVIVSTKTKNTDFFVDRLRQAFTPQSDTVEVLVWANGATHDKSVVYPSHAKNASLRPLREGQYLGMCIEGACTEGDQVRFTDENILGERVTS